MYVIIYFKTIFLFKTLNKIKNYNKAVVLPISQNKNTGEKEVIQIND
ncbi:hypothetical protein [uncultured Fusobacterium sp.]|nr:hypothetical protein [uncultured Fusobacterium sp.]